MSKIRIIGDVHGKFKRYRELIRDIPASIQLGDMGVGFYKMIGSDILKTPNPPYDAMSDGNHLFIRGNHDNPFECSKHPYYIPDGTYNQKMFFLGGATSIDKKFRTKDIDWWEDEECSEEELESLIQKYSEVKPEIMFTHEAPQSVADEILSTFNMQKINDPSRTRVSLERMMYIHQPKQWFFGHWHRSIQFKRGDTIFQCLNELEYTDIEI